MRQMLGSSSFLIGVVIAIVFGFLGRIEEAVAIILVILGLLVGLLNITDKEIKPFLMSGAVIVIVSSLGATAVENIEWFSNILRAIMFIFVPATIIVALKSVFSMAKD